MSPSDAERDRIRWAAEALSRAISPDRELDDLVARYAQVINELAHEREQPRVAPPAGVLHLRPT